MGRRRPAGPATRRTAYKPLNFTEPSDSSFARKEYLLLSRSLAVGDRVRFTISYDVCATAYDGGNPATVGIDLDLCFTTTTRTRTSMAHSPWTTTARVRRHHHPAERCWYVQALRLAAGLGHHQLRRVQLDDGVLGGAVGDLVTRAVAFRAALLLLLASASCSDVTLQEKDAGDPPAEPQADPCETNLVRDASDVAGKESCCAANCEVAYTANAPDAEGVCVNKSRLCYSSCTDEKYTAECPSGYECVMFSTQCSSVCNPSGEFNAGAIGYCIWASIASTQYADAFPMWHYLQNDQPGLWPSVVTSYYAPGRTPDNYSFMDHSFDFRDMPIVTY